MLSNFEYVIIVIPNDWCKHYTTKLCKQKNHFYFTSRTKCLNEQTLVYGHNNWIWVSKFYLEQLMSRKQDFNSSKNSSREFIVLIRALSKNDWHILLQIMMYSNHQKQQKYPFVKKNVKMKIKTLLLDKNRDLSRTKLWWCNWVYKRYKKIKIMSCNFNIKDDQYRKALFLCWSYKEWMWELKYRYKAHCIPLRHHVCKNTWFYYFLCWLRNK